MRSEHIDLLDQALMFLDSDHPAWEFITEIRNDVMKPIWSDSNGEEYFEDDIALSELIDTESIICYPAQVTLDSGGEHHFIGLAVQSSDVFMWACTDFEPCVYEDIRALYDASQTSFGIDKWVCKHRGCQPQWPLKQQMKTANVWDAEMAALRKNSDWKEEHDA